MLHLGADEDAVGDHVPVEHHVARAGQGERPALGVAHEALREGAAREGVLHHGEADEHDDEHEAADQAGGTRSVSWPITVNPAVVTQAMRSTQVGMSITARS